MIRFIKMHGLGNDFVILDLRVQQVVLDQQFIQRICHRRWGIGCDQLVTIGHGHHIAFYNPDGSESATCGNASRCIADMLMQEEGSHAVTLHTKERAIACRMVKDLVEVDMGSPKEAWQDIPLSHKMHIEAVDIAPFTGGYALSMGNPHIVFFVEEPPAELADANQLAQIERHHYFPERVNVSLARIVNNSEIDLIVWERGAGFTQACGSAACATAYAAYKKGLVNHQTTIHLPGGHLMATIAEDSHIHMRGPVAYIAKGEYHA